MHTKLYSRKKLLVSPSLIDNPFGASVLHHISTRGTHPTLGLILFNHKDNGRLLLKECTSATPSARIPKWRSELRNSILISVNDEPVSCLLDVIKKVASSRTDQAVPKMPIKLLFIPALKIPTHSDLNIPQIHFDQLATNFNLTQ